MDQNCEFCPLRTCKGWKLTKSRNFEPCSKFGSKWDFWPLRTCEEWNWSKSGNFESRWKFGKKQTFLTTRDMRRRKFGKIQKFSVTLKFGSNYESFDHSEPAKDEIWQNPDKFWFVLKILLKNEIFTTPDLRRMKFCKIKKFWFMSNI